MNLICNGKIIKNRLKTYLKLFLDDFHFKNCIIFIFINIYLIKILIFN